ncbi:MAG: 4Fe-4S binding protein [Deltaproteobacteria bacterium]|nr:4Fe-4S binding protein [Deltaproteobacteria bacterium]
MEANFLPLWKTLDTPLVSLDESCVELFSVLALFLLSMVVMLARSRHRQIVRHLVQLVALMVFFYIVYSCLGVFGMVRNTLHGISLIGSVYTEAFFWVSLPFCVLAFSITAGPFFCGWICPTGFFQELLAMLREQALRIPPVARLARRRPGRALTFVGLGLFFAGFMGLVIWLGTTKRFYVEDSSLYWAASLILVVFLVLTRRADDRAVRALKAVSLAIIVGSALLKTAIISPMHFAFADVRDPASALTTLVLVVASLFLSQAWCRYVCPWGYLMGCLHGVSRLRVVRAAAKECTGCRACERACRVDAIERGQVRLEDCHFCLACVDRCPAGALEIADVWKQGAAKKQKAPGA